MTVPAQTLRSTVEQTFDAIGVAGVEHVATLALREVGIILSLSTGIARVHGLPNVGYDELVSFPGRIQGIAFNLVQHEIGVVLLGDYTHLQAGDEVLRTGQVMDIAPNATLLERCTVYRQLWAQQNRHMDKQGPRHAALAQNLVHGD